VLSKVVAALPFSGDSGGESDDPPAHYNMVGSGQGYEQRPNSMRAPSPTRNAESLFYSYRVDKLSNH
jgi:hypothetical protein